MQKRGLGRGLGALLPEVDESTDQVNELEIGRISPNPEQPRQHFGEAAIEELAASIREHGVVQPIIVRPDGDSYQLIAGERRLRAARRAGLERIPAIVRSMSDAQALEVALIENLQREDLNPMEEAEAFKKLSEEFSLTQEQVSARVGKSRPHIANTLRLLNLASDVQQMVREARLSMGHARALLALESATVQKAAAERIVSKQMSVREAEEYVNALLGRVQRRPGQKSKQRKDPQVEEIETRMRGVLGTRVKITGNTSRGRMEIHYFSQEELERVVDAILMRLDEVNGFGE